MESYRAILMNVLKKQQGQSAAEFVLAFPVFLFALLGIVQLGIIFYNAVILKYTVYMAARVAVVHDEKERNNKTRLAALQLNTAMAAANTCEKPGADMIINTAKGLLTQEVSGFLIENVLRIKKEKIKTSKGEFLRITAKYALPLKVPVANKIFGFFNKEPAAVAAGLAGYPVFTLKSTAVMRVEKEKNRDEKNNKK